MKEILKQQRSENVEKEQKNVKNKIHISKKVIIGVVIILIAIYLIYSIYLLIKQPTDIFTLEEGNLYSDETDIGYIIRD